MRSWSSELVAIMVDREAWDDPNDLPQEVHDRADVIEHGAQSLMTQINHDQTSQRQPLAPDSAPGSPAAVPPWRL